MRHAHDGVHALLRCPVVVAPMAGGPSTPDLVVAAAAAGALGFLAGGYKTASALMAEIAAVRSRTGAPFGVNLFVPGTPSAAPEAVRSYLETLAPDARAVGVDLGEAAWDDDGFDEKLEAVAAAGPPLVSFTFGCPSGRTIDACHDAGSAVAVTVTSPEEALVADRAGADVLCVQGAEAGAHRGTFANADPSGRDDGVLALVTAVSHVTDLPQFAAGGIMQAEQVAAVLAAGAVAAQCGTAFLRCPESGAHPIYKAALAQDRFTTTTVTRAFSGRPARGLVNRFLVDHSDAPDAYPEINNATRPLRSAAAARGDIDRMSLWAGQGFRHATDLPAGEVVDLLSPR